MSAREGLLPIDGPGAPPRANGELIFDEPWQSRIFGITLALHEAGRFAWPEFQARLIEAIARHESELRKGWAGEGEPPGYDYYGCWIVAFRSLAADKGWLTLAKLDALESEMLARPLGHDH